MELEKISWTPLHAHSWLSLQDAISNPDLMAKKCKELGYTAAAITDHGSIAGHPSFSKACKKEGIKPILGCEFYVSWNAASLKDSSNKSLAHAVILAKNLAGWYEMIQCVSESNLPDNFYYKPRIDLGIMQRFLGNGNHVCIIGHPGTMLSNCLFSSNNAYNAKTVEEAETFLLPEWESKALSIIQAHENIFGDNLYIEIQLIDQEFLPASQIVAKCLRHMVAEYGYKPVATADSHYINREDAELQRILLCSSLGRTMGGVERDLQEGKEVPMKTFFISNNYHIPSLEEMQAIHTEKELANAVKIGDMCEDYDILGPPQLPHFQCPGGKTELEYLTELCRIGWKELLVKDGKVSKPEMQQVYVDRVKEELSVIEDANLSGYFLIVQDIIRFCKSKGWLPGPGRGSASGSLVSYLSGITSIDPIPCNLLFSRFFDNSRKNDVPDIDLDVPSQARDEIVEYIRRKYDVDKVCQMVTFGSLMGRSSMKEVIRICGDISFAEMNEITEFIPDEAAIADELEASGETSVIRWTLANRAKKLEKWCKLEEDGSLSGDLADLFKKAIALEGTPKSQGKHAAGVIISSVSLADVCPMVRDSSGNPIAGWEMNALADCGHVKFDVLGLSHLDKVMEVSEDGGFDISDMSKFNDAKTWELFASGDTKGIFQLERQSRWTKKLKPENIDHLAALVAIIRPGVAEAMLDGKSMTEHYIDRKNGLEEPTYMHDSLKPVLQDTYGIIVYQESAMRLARELAGFSLKEANLLRKAMGKKLTSLMANVKSDFIEGCKTQKIVSDDIAEKIFDWIQKAQRYSFCAGHAYAYAVNAYQSAYCKAHNLLKFYEVYMNYADSKIDRLEEINDLINDARAHNIETIGPSLLHFHKNFTKTENNTIYFGVAHIKDVGEKDVEKLFEIIEKSDKELAILSWMDILLLFGCKGVNKKAFHALASTGAISGPNNKVSRTRMSYEYDIWKKLTIREIKFISEFGDLSKDIRYNIEYVINNLGKITAKRAKVLVSCLDLLDKPTYDLNDNPRYLASMEKKYMGISIKYSATDDSDMSGADTTCYDIISGNVRDKSTVGLAVELSTIREHKIKKEGANKNKLMAFLSVQDNSGKLKSVTVFPGEYLLYKDLFFDNNTLLINGKVESRNGEKSLIVEKVFQI